MKITLKQVRALADHRLHHPLHLERPDRRGRRHRDLLHGRRAASSPTCSTSSRPSSPPGRRAAVGRPSMARRSLLSMLLPTPDQIVRSYLTTDESIDPRRPARRPTRSSSRPRRSCCSSPSSCILLGVWVGSGGSTTVAAVGFIVLDLVVIYLIIQRLQVLVHPLRPDGLPGDPLVGHPAAPDGVDPVGQGDGHLHDPELRSAGCWATPRSASSPPTRPPASRRSRTCASPTASTAPSPRWWRPSRARPCRTGCRLHDESYRGAT